MDPNDTSGGDTFIVKLPFTYSVPEPANFPYPGFKKLKHSTVPETVTVVRLVVASGRKITVSVEVGTDAPVVAAYICWDEMVPDPDVVQVFPLPPVIVPALVYAPVNGSVLYQTVIPTTNAGDPVVVSVVPERDAVNPTGTAVAQLLVLVPSQVPVPPTQ
jgi:hypothetical protein